MKIFTFIVVALISLTVFGTEKTALPAVSNLPKDAPYLDEVTGVEFPACTGFFCKEIVKKNPNPVFGTLVRYANERGSCADVYIYSLNTVADPVAEKEFEAHFAETKENILSLASKPEDGHLKSVSEKTMKSPANEWMEKIPSLRQATFLFGIAEDEYYSELHMFLCKGRIIKIRISYPSDIPEEAENAKEFLNALLSLFHNKTVDHNGCCTH